MIALNVCISGFTQDVGGRGHGLFRLSENLIEKGHNKGVERRVWCLRWNENWKRWAEQVALIGLFHNQEVLVAVYAYSWGGGWGAVRLATFLKQQGIGVRYMVLCDPVHRPWFPLLRFKALYRRDVPILTAPVIRIPSNVGEVFSFHQTMNRPQAHRLLPLNGTKINPSVRLLRTHETMDDAPEFHRQAMAVAELLAEEADGCTVSGKYKP